MKEKWIEDLREGMSDFEMDAPEGLWESLGVESPAPVSSWRKKIAVAATILALLTVGSVLILWLTHVERIEVSNTRIAAYKSPHDNAESEPAHNITTATKPTSPTLAKAVQKIILPSNEENNEIVSVVSPTGEENITASTDSVSQEVKQESTETDIRNFRNSHTGKGESLYAGQTSKNKTYVSHSGRYAVAAYASGIGHTTESMGHIPGHNVGDDPLWNDNNSNSPPSFENPNDSPITIENHHYQPIKAGITFQYKLNNRIGLETGLTYTALTSDLTVCQGNNASAGRRRMHYLGIPLNIKLYLWSWKSINLYLSAGVMGEKCVSNRFQTRFESEGLSLEQYSSQTGKPFQWSVNAAPGLQIKPLPNIGIFAEPGISYYFNDGTTIPTIYKDRPCNFNLNLGIRFNLNP